MESLNDLIWNEEDENIADVTRDYLTEIVCLIACQYEGAGTPCNGGPPAQ